MFLKAQDMGFLKGFQVSNFGVGFLILQFVDDTSVFTSGSLSEAKVVKNNLLWFEASSGLKGNTTKTVLFEVNKVDELNDVLNLGHCKQDSFPDVYLGLPLGAKYRCVAVWDPLIDRFKSKLALWKRHYLSKGGRLVLIKSTLQNLSVYLLSCRIVPVTVVEEIEKIMRKFLWGHSGW